MKRRRWRRWWLAALLIQVWVTGAAESYYVDRRQVQKASNGRTEIIVVGGGPGNSAASIKIPGYGRLQDRPKWPGTSPASAVNNPRPWNEQGDYVTPTPLPYRPQWGIKQWVEYFKDHHPNFYMHEQLRKNMTMAEEHRSSLPSGNEGSGESELPPPPSTSATLPADQTTAAEAKAVTPTTVTATEPSSSLFDTTSIGKVMEAAMEEMNIISFEEAMFREGSSTEVLAEDDDATTTLFSPAELSTEPRTQVEGAATTEKVIIPGPSLLSSTTTTTMLTPSTTLTTSTSETPPETSTEEENTSPITTPGILFPETILFPGPGVTTTPMPVVETTTTSTTTVSSLATTLETMQTAMFSMMTRMGGMATEAMAMTTTPSTTATSAFSTTTKTITTPAPMSSSAPTPPWLTWSLKDWVSWSQNQDHKNEQLDPLKLYERHPELISIGLAGDKNERPLLHDPTKKPHVDKETTEDPTYLWSSDRESGSLPKPLSQIGFLANTLKQQQKPSGGQKLFTPRPNYGPFGLMPLTPKSAMPVNKASLLVKAMQKGEEIKSTEAPAPTYFTPRTPSTLPYPYTTTQRPVSSFSTRPPHRHQFPHYGQARPLSSFSVRSPLDHASRLPQTTTSGPPPSMMEHRRPPPHQQQMQAAFPNLYDFVVNTFGKPSRETAVAAAMNGLGFISRSANVAGAVGVGGGGGTRPVYRQPSYTHRNFNSWQRPYTAAAATRAPVTGRPAATYRDGSFYQRIGILPSTTTEAVDQTPYQPPASNPQSSSLDSIRDDFKPITSIKRTSFTTAFTPATFETTTETSSTTTTTSTTTAAEGVTGTLDELKDVLSLFRAKKIHYNVPQDEGSLGPGLPLAPVSAESRTAGGMRVQLPVAGGFRFRQPQVQNRRPAESDGFDSLVPVRPVSKATYKTPYRPAENVFDMSEPKAGTDQRFHRPKTPPSFDGSLQMRPRPPTGIVFSSSSSSSSSTVPDVSITGFPLRVPNDVQSLGPTPPPRPEKQEFSQLLTNLEALIGVLRGSYTEARDALVGRPVATTTTATTTTTTTTTTERPVGAATVMINMLRAAPLEDRRRMLAYMMLGVPMAALTMATVGVPALYIAPLSMVIPGYMMGAFMETAPVPGFHSHSPSRPHRSGVAALMQAIRDYRLRQMQRGQQTTNPTSAPIQNVIESDSQTRIRRSARVESSESARVSLLDNLLHVAYESLQSRLADLANEANPQLAAADLDVDRIMAAVSEVASDPDGPMYTFTMISLAVPFVASLLSINTGLPVSAIVSLALAAPMYLSQHVEMTV